MNEQTIKLLSELAAKLGTTADHLWSVLARQAYVAMAQQIFAAVVFSVALFFWFRLVKRMTTEIPEGKSYPRWDDEGALCAWASVFALLLFAGVSLGFAIDSIITATFNPEYFAFEQLTKLLKR